MKTKRIDPEIQLSLDLVNEGYRKKAWHGPNLRGSVRGLTPQEAAWRPAANRHNIWENVVHCAYWKYIVRRRILGEEKGSFPLKGSNWFARPEIASARAWEQDLELLETCHRTMYEAIAGLRATDLLVIPKGSTVSNANIIRGIASHDIYHAGQIQLLKRLMR